jgi:thymidylate kinase
MLVIIEGCDGTGKSTLAARLAERLDGAEVLHLGPPKRHPLEETVLALDDYTPGSGRHVIVDRFHLGEMIYGPIYRGESKLGPLGGPEHKWVDLWLKSRGALQVVLTATLKTVEDRIGVRGDDFVKNEHLRSILREYAQAAHLSMVATNSHVYPLEGIEEMLLEDAALLEAAVVASRMFEVTDRWTGDPDPLTLLVGEETSPAHLRGRRPMYKAPFVPYPNTSGWYLLDVLPADVLTRCAIVNALEVDLPAVLGRLQPRHVVALGGKARAALTEARIGRPFFTTDHPQFVRRFHHDRLPEWGAHLAALAQGKEFLPWR